MVPASGKKQLGNRFRGTDTKGESMRQTTRTVVSLAVAGVFAGGASQAFASAFALIEQSASRLGNSFAGAAAAAEDASTIFYNPAGMTYLKGPADFSLGFAYISVNAKF